MVLRILFLINYWSGLNHALAKRFCSSSPRQLAFHQTSASWPIPLSTDQNFLRNRIPRSLASENLPREGHIKRSDDSYDQNWDANPHQRHGAFALLFFLGNLCGKKGKTNKKETKDGKGEWKNIYYTMRANCVFDVDHQNLSVVNISWWQFKTLYN